MKVFYTDGSASPNPGPGGYAVVSGGHPVALGSEGGDTTNIRMEGRALIAALGLAAGAECSINTDSEFWINVITKWAPGWKANGWRKKSRGEIQNLDLVRELYDLYSKSPKAKLVWVKGHNNDPGNELADEWANKARMGERLNDDDSI
jgi:ribonuclease HI